MWNPWRRLADFAQVKLRWHDDVLPPGKDGLTEFDNATITIRPGLTQAQRRSVLTHELVHVERGPFPAWTEPREERIVCAEAARRLITLEQLADALVWCSDEHQAAEHLWVDVPTVVARLGCLSAAESSELNQLLDDAELQIP